MSRFHRGRDGWGRDSYRIPQYAVVGSSYCGEWEDAPVRGADVVAEFKCFRADLRKATGILCHKPKPTQSGNVFMVKVWLAVKPADFDRAAQFAVDWLAQHDRDTRCIHDADLDELGYKARGAA